MSIGATPSGSTAEAGTGAGSRTGAGLATGSGSVTTMVSITVSEAAGTASGLAGRLVNACSTSKVGLELSKNLSSSGGNGSIGAGFAALGKRPNPERIPPKAYFRAFRHHGIGFSVICIPPAIPDAVCYHVGQRPRQSCSRDHFLRSAPGFAGSGQLHGGTHLLHGLFSATASTAGTGFKNFFDPRLRKAGTAGLDGL